MPGLTYDPRGVFKLIESVLKAVQDGESKEGGWGPDVTMVGVLKDGLRAVGIDPDKVIG